MALNPFLTKLEHGVELNDADRQKLLEVVAQAREVPAGEDLISEGERPETVRLVISGWGFRYKRLPDGRRQIMSFLLPGDSCNMHVAILRRMDHSIGTIAPTTVVEIPRSTIKELTSEHPGIARALWWATLVEEGVMREWLVNMGQRPTDRAMGHLFCEVLERLRVVGLARGTSYDFPLTQEDLGDALGVSGVHVNRMLKELRADNLITLRAGVLSILDEPRLKKFSGYKSDYLHLDCRELA